MVFTQEFKLLGSSPILRWRKQILKFLGINVVPLAGLSLWFELERYRIVYELYLKFFIIESNLKNVFTAGFAFNVNRKRLLLIYSMLYTNCQKRDSNPRPEIWTATWTQRLWPLGHSDVELCFELIILIKEDSTKIKIWNHVFLHFIPADSMNNIMSKTLQFIFSWSSLIVL